MVLYISCDIQMKQVSTLSPSLSSGSRPDQTCEQGGPFSDEKWGDGQGTLHQATSDQLSVSSLGGGGMTPLSTTSK